MEFLGFWVWDCWCLVAGGRDWSLQDTTASTAAKDFHLNWTEGREHRTWPGFPSVPAGKQEISPLNIYISLRRDIITQGILESFGVLLG